MSRGFFIWVGVHTHVLFLLSTYTQGIHAPNVEVLSTETVTRLLTRQEH